MAVSTSNTRHRTTLHFLFIIAILTTAYCLFTISGVGSGWQLVMVKYSDSTCVDTRHEIQDDAPVTMVTSPTSTPTQINTKDEDSPITSLALPGSPSSTSSQIDTKDKDSPITILAWTRISFIKTSKWGTGREPFEHFQCPVSNCLWTDQQDDINKVDALIFHMRLMGREQQNALLSKQRPSGQKWIAYIRESQNRVINIKYLHDMVNATMGYRHGMDIPYPYGFIHPRTSQQWRPPAHKDYTKGKTKMVAWIASNCLAVQSPRLQYAKELKKHVQVDIYGGCGDLNCNYTLGYFEKEDPCFSMINQTYKFYLAFENSICLDYMTEKFYRTLQWDIIPIVMGGANYTGVLPLKSFIDVRDFPSPKDLASYLKLLDSDPKLYNSFFEWKRDFYAEENSLINGKFFCDICEYLHRTRSQTKQYGNLAKWFREGECTDKDEFYSTVNHSS